MTRRLPDGAVSRAELERLADMIERRWPDMQTHLPTMPTINREFRCGNARAGMARRIVNGRRAEKRRILGITIGPIGRKV
jgi:hypothetical protein